MSNASLVLGSRPTSTDLLFRFDADHGVDVYLAHMQHPTLYGEAAVTLDGLKSATLVGSPAGFHPGQMGLHLMAITKVAQTAHSGNHTLSLRVDRFGPQGAEQFRVCGLLLEHGPTSTQAAGVAVG